MTRSIYSLGVLALTLMSSITYAGIPSGSCPGLLFGAATGVSSGGGEGEVSPFGLPPTTSVVRIDTAGAFDFQGIGDFPVLPGTMAMDIANTEALFYFESGGTFYKGLPGEAPTVVGPTGKVGFTALSVLDYGFTSFAYAVAFDGSIGSVDLTTGLFTPLPVSNPGGVLLEGLAIDEYSAGGSIVYGVSSSPAPGSLYVIDLSASSPSVTFLVTMMDTGDGLPVTGAVEGLDHDIDSDVFYFSTSNGDILSIPGAGMAAGFFTIEGQVLIDGSTPSPVRALAWNSVPVANDSCFSSRTVAVPSRTLHNSIFACDELVPIDGCGAGPPRDLWYQFTAPTDGFYEISTCSPGTDFDTVLELYKDTGVDLGPCNSLSVDCNDDGSCCDLESRVRVPLTPGDYFIRVFGYGGDVGKFELTVLRDCNENGIDDVVGDIASGSSLDVNPPFPYPDECGPIIGEPYSVPFFAPPSTIGGFCSDVSAVAYCGKITQILADGFSLPTAVLIDPLKAEDPKRDLASVIDSYDITRIKVWGMFGDFTAAGRDFQVVIHPGSGNVPDNSGSISLNFPAGSYVAQDAPQKMFEFYPMQELTFHISPPVNAPTDLGSFIEVYETNAAPDAASQFIWSVAGCGGFGGGGEGGNPQRLGIFDEAGFAGTTDEIPGMTWKYEPSYDLALEVLADPVFSGGGPAQIGSNDADTAQISIAGDPTVSIQVLNTGVGNWMAEYGYELRVISDSCGLASTNTILPPSATPVAPGEYMNFDLPIALPPDGTECTIELMMFQDQRGYFGESVTVTVGSGGVVNLVGSEAWRLYR